jgi:hypothetical protein
MPMKLEEAARKMVVREIEKQLSKNDFEIIQFRLNTLIIESGTIDILKDNIQEIIRQSKDTNALK